MKIDPAKATPQAPLALRADVSAGAPRADEEDGDGPDSEEEGPPSSKDDADAMGQHEALRAAAEEAHTKAAEAYKASKGTDSAAALMHAEDMGDAAGEAHGAAKASSMKLRGATEPAPPTQRPGNPPPPAGARVQVAPIARAVAVAGGSSIAAQTEIAARLACLDRVLGIFPGATLDTIEGLARAAVQDAADAAGLRAAAEKAAKKAKKREVEDAEKALHAKLSAAVRAGKYARAELFDVAETVDAEGKTIEVLTPLAWVRDMKTAALDAMIAKKQARAGNGGPPLVPDEAPINISAALLKYGQARGWPEGDPRYAAMAAHLPATIGATAPTEAQ